jgi:hypothetical protein
MSGYHQLIFSGAGHFTIHPIKDLARIQQKKWLKHEGSSCHTCPESSLWYNTGMCFASHEVT